mgnify:CR=1 FL=1
MKLLIIILCALLFAGCADKNLTMKGVQAFDAENYTTAYEELAPLAVRGDPEAQFYVAKMHYFGFGIPKDLDIAFIRYTDSAEQGYMKAQHNLGLMYINGLSTDTNPELGYEWIAKAAAQGFALSQFMMGVALTMEGSPLQQDITRGLEYYEAAALQNYPAALTQLGEHFAFREVNYSKAGDYFDKGAALGDPQAMHRLSYIYMGGTLRTQDKERAHNLLKTSAEKKYLPSYYDLAMSYFLGNGVTQSAEQGIKWMKKSAIEANNALAQFNLGAMYDKGEDVPENNAEAVKWYRKAADQGNAVAQSNLGDMYVKGEGVPENHAEAVKWFRKAADQGNARSQAQLGIHLMKGDGILKDPDKGIQLLTEAAKNGGIDAQYFLGLIYSVGSQEAGLGRYIETDEKKAKYWLSMAIAQGDSRADEVLLVLNAELKARKEEAARQQEIYRLERIARFEKAQREKRAAEKQLAEYKRQQEYQARQPKRPSLVESFIGGLFEAAVDGAVMYGQAKINKELGIKSPQERQLDDFRRVADEENERMLRLIRKERRMEKIMKDLRTTPSIGYKN